MGGRVSALPRLMLALSTSGLVLGFFAGARFGHPWWAAALAPVPLLVAMRCLPLGAGLAVALGVGAGARVLASVGLPLAGGLAEAALGALALMPALLADRLLVPRRPRLGAAAFVGLVLLTTAIARAFESSIAPLPVSAEGALGALADRVGWAISPLVCASLAQGLAGLASVGNWHRPDPLPQAERETSVRAVAVAAALLALAALLGSTLL